MISDRLLTIKKNSKDYKKNLENHLKQIKRKFSIGETDKTPLRKMKIFWLILR